MGVETNNTNPADRQPQQDQEPQQQGRKMDQQPGQSQQVGETSRRIDTDDDGRTRDPNDTSPSDNGGKGGGSAQQ